MKMGRQCYGHCKKVVIVNGLTLDKSAYLLARAAEARLVCAIAMNRARWWNMPRMGEFRIPLMLHDLRFAYSDLNSHWGSTHRGGYELCADHH